MVISQSRNEQNATIPNKEIHFVWYSRSRKKISDMVKINLLGRRAWPFVNQI